MSTELLLSLATDYIQLLQYPDEDFNVLIKIGENNDYQEFKAHSVILRSRSTYFRIALSNQWVKKEGDYYIFQKSNISPETFEIILKFIYSGTINLENFSCYSVMNLLVAADELCLNQLVDYAQDYFVANGLDWLRDNFYDVFFTIFAHDNFEKLQKSCSKIIAQDPKNHQHYFTQWPEKLILEVLQREDLQLEEIDVWDTIVRWGAAQVGLSTQSVNQWTKEDFSKLSNKLKNCIKHIRFYHISVADFSNRVLPFSDALSDEVYGEIFHHILMKYTINLLPPRGISLDSEIIGIRHAALIASWIDRQETYNRWTCQMVPYHFNLLLRGSRDGFKEETFHQLCDNQGPALVVAKIKDTGELIGGYNPVGWKSSGLWIETTESFIFSLGNGSDSNLKRAILSRVQNTTCSIDDSPNIGPCFGVSDLVMVLSSQHSWGKLLYNFPWTCKKSCYQFPITNNSNFAIDNYEVFKLVRKDS
ncbi:hypothetical protein Glove_680g50 [Diversispora epigaea]|uniref:BTB domain-containing protein n=1 Tax=Diversispora epigaea TaxID=1348612 RepID=A0A397G690_9GLOM|nr:hypothetical protein Glove_680g50 [Diversispora epigaea]